MESINSQAPTDASMAILSDLEARAERFETPCGEGSLVWRRWGAGPPLMLLHGSHGSWMHWVRNIDALAERRQVWALDLPGLGESALPPEPEHPAISDAIAIGLRKLLPAGTKIDAVGFSFGGVVAAYLAGRHRDLVRRLVLVDTGGLNTPHGDFTVQGMRGLDPEGREAANRANLHAMMLNNPDSIDALAVHLHAGSAKKSRINTRDLVLPDRLIQAFPHIGVQVDAIWGEFDQLHPDPPAQEAVLRAQWPDMEFHVIAGAGHWPMYDRPAAFNGVLTGVLETPLR